MSINGDDPAFPAVCDGIDGMEFVVFGLTKREHFAALAMQGVWANGQIVSKHHASPDEETIARWSVAAADALIAALNEEPKP